MGQVLHRSSFLEIRQLHFRSFRKGWTTILAVD
jgi:hypothetical protein